MKSVSETECVAGLCSLGHIIMTRFYCGNWSLSVTCYHRAQEYNYSCRDTLHTHTHSFCPFHTHLEATAQTKRLHWRGVFWMYSCKMRSALTVDVWGPCFMSHTLLGSLNPHERNHGHRHQWVKLLLSLCDVILTVIFGLWHAVHLTSEFGQMRCVQLYHMIYRCFCLHLWIKHFAHVLCVIWTKIKRKNVSPLDQTLFQLGNKK